MHMSRLTHRLQVLLDDDRLRRLEEAAAKRGTSVATIVREAIDDKLPAGDDARRAAARYLLAAPPIDIGSEEDLKAEILSSLDRFQP